MFPRRPMVRGAILFLVSAFVFFPAMSGVADKKIAPSLRISEAVVPVLQREAELPRRLPEQNRREGEETPGAGRSVAIVTRTVWFKPANLEGQLAQNENFQRAGMVVVADPYRADLLITIDRPVGTWEWSYSIQEAATSVVFAFGKVEADSGREAAPKLAREIATRLLARQAGRRPERVADRGLTAPPMSDLPRPPARAVAVTTRTVWFKPANLERELAQNADFRTAGMVVVNDPERADLVISIDRPIGTHEWTFSIAEKPSTVVFAFGKVEADSGRDAAPKLARAIVERLLRAQEP